MYNVAHKYVEDNFCTPCCKCRNIESSGLILSVEYGALKHAVMVCMTCMTPILDEGLEMMNKFKGAES